MIQHRPATFRPDIEGLRAIAITAVVLYHAGVPGFGGGFVGVDLFFVLSGFLITGLLLRELERTGRIGLADFWARRVRRLLPAATVVLVFTAIVSMAAVSPAERGKVASAIRYATLYAANWFFAADSLDYLTADEAPNPVLHFWSLGVEEQFYFVWPVLLLVAAAWMRGRRFPLRPSLLVVGTAIWTCSFAISLHYTASAQPLAFFGSPARFWQLATGALLAIGAPRVARLSGPQRAGLQYAGLGLLLWCVAFLGERIAAGAAYPGWLALLPTFATAALVAGGDSRRTPIHRLLTSRPALWIGGLSYSWYLWHWPVLTLWHRWRSDPGTIGNVLLVLVALAFAVAAHRWIENPIRYAQYLQSRAAVSLALGAALMATTLGAAWALEQRDAAHLEARSGADFRPLPSAALDDLPSIYGNGCRLLYEQTSGPACRFGDVTSERRIVLFGDSHAGNLFDATSIAAGELGYRLDVRIKTGCPVADVHVWNKRREQWYRQCDTWREGVIAEIVRTHPDAVVLVNEANSPPSVATNTGAQVTDAQRARALWDAGYRRTLERLEATGTRVIVVRDNPFTPKAIPDCVSAHLEQPQVCDAPRALSLPEPAADVRIARQVPGVHVIDLTDAVCDDEVCFAVLDGVLVWRDRHHYTSTFSKTLAPRMRAALMQQLPTR